MGEPEANVAASQSEPNLVSVCMPVMDGETFLARALDALLAQTYRHLEIIILDDLSTDRTPDICHEYARKDSRIRYIRDDRHRISHDAANELARYVTGEYCMLACDDDLWEPEYIQVLAEMLNDHPEVGLAYSNADMVDLSGVCSGRPMLRARKLFQASDSQLRNFSRYLSHRQVVPLVFGLFRTGSYAATLPWDTFDETIADVDNLFLLKLFSRFKAQSVDRVLFHYRSKYRWADPDVLRTFPRSGNPGAVWLYQFRHEWRFARKVFEVIDRAAFSTAESGFLKASTVAMLAHSMTTRRPIALARDAAYGLLVRLGLRRRLHAPATDSTAAVRHAALVARLDASERD